MDYVAAKAKRELEQILAISKQWHFTHYCYRSYQPAQNLIIETYVGQFCFSDNQQEIS